MIASLRGVVTHVGLDTVVLETGGVGLLAHTTPATASECRTGAEAALATSLVVREDSLTLYAFGSAEERDLFEAVQTVSGVGPRLALAMLAVHTPTAVRVAVGTGDLKALQKVPGVGRKSAERLVLELRDRIGLQSALAGEPEGPLEPVTASTGPAWAGQVSEALVGLGWSSAQAGDAVARVQRARVAAGEPEDAPVSEMLRACLRELGR